MRLRPVISDDGHDRDHSPSTKVGQLIVDTEYFHLISLPSL